MEVEKAIEQILQIQAAAEGRMDKMERQLGTISNLMRTGMKLVINIREVQKTAEFKINALIDSGQRTDHRLTQLAEAQAISEQKLYQRIAELGEGQATSDKKFDHRLTRLAEAQAISEQKLDQRMAKLAEGQATSDKKFDQNMAALAEAQTLTEQKLASFIDALRKNKTNGHN
jgi:hypothetical protein